MCLFEIDKTGFPLLARHEDETFYHFFPLTRVQFEEAIAAGWLPEDKHLDLEQSGSIDNLIARGEVSFPAYASLPDGTPEHNFPIEIMLFPGGYKALSQLARTGLLDITDANIYSFYLTNLKQKEFGSLIRWLGGERWTGTMVPHKKYNQCHYQFMQFHIKDLIGQILELEGLNPRAVRMLELFRAYKGVINGLPRDIFEMTGNYIEGPSERLAEYSWGKRSPGLDRTGHPLYYPVIAGETKMWPYIPVHGKMRHLKVESHPLVGARGMFKRRK